MVHWIGNSLQIVKTRAHLIGFGVFPWLSQFSFHACDSESNMEFSGGEKWPRELILMLLISVIL